MNTNRISLFMIRNTEHGGTLAKSDPKGPIIWSNAPGYEARTTLRFFDRTLADRVAAKFPNAEVVAPLSMIEPTDRVKSFVADCESYARKAIGEVTK